MPAPQPIALSLVPHTNAGKTTLARTLLSRDIGEVCDAPHDTEFADARWRDPGFWASQQALKNVREQADVVLYLVNAAEEPAAAGSRRSHRAGEQRAGPARGLDEHDRPRPARRSAHPRSGRARADRCRPRR